MLTVGSKSRGDFCNFPQKQLVTVKLICLSFGWMSSCLGSQAVLGSFVAFLSTQAGVLSVGCMLGKILTKWSLDLNGFSLFSSM